MPAFNEMHRLLKPGSFCLSVYDWNTADKFVGAWRAPGFRPVGHIVFTKCYASLSRFVRSRHEQAYLIAKDDPRLHERPIDDLRDWSYSGKRLHPTQKSVKVLQHLIEAFCRADGVVLNPFCGPGSILIVAQLAGRAFTGIELDADHCEIARMRLACNELLTA